MSSTTTPQQQDLEDLSTTDPDQPTDPNVGVERRGEPELQPEQEEAEQEKPANAGIVRMGSRDLSAIEKEIASAAAVVIETEEDGARLIPIKQIRESRSNPRKIFGDLDGMVASIQKVGIIHDLVVRRVDGPHAYEVVVGHRRLRAAKLAGLTDVPCRVVELGDRECLELQLAENIERRTLSVLEEAEGLFRLHTDGGVAAKDIAPKVGKSERWVQARIQLTKLGPEARAWLEKDATRVSVATLLAAVHSHKLQADAVDDILRIEKETGDPMSYRTAKDYIRSTYTTELRGVAFDQKDDMLVPDAGSCTKCPKRTGNNPELMSEYKRADVCLDVPCFKSKLEAHWEAIRSKAKADGMKSLSLQQGRQVFKPGATSLASDLVDLGAACPNDKKRRTWGEVLGDKGTDPALVTVTVVPDASGHPHRMVDKAAALQVAKKSGIKWAGGVAEQAQRRRGPTKEDAAEQKRQADIRRDVEDAVIDKAVANAEQLGASVPLPILRLLCLGMAHTNFFEDLMRRRGLGEDSAELVSLIEKSSAPKLLGLALEMAVSSWVRAGGDDYSPELYAFAKVLKVDFAAIEKAVVTAAPAEELFKKKKAKKSA